MNHAQGLTVDPAEKKQSCFSVACALIVGLALLLPGAAALAEGTLIPTQIVMFIAMPEADGADQGTRGSPVKFQIFLNTNVTRTATPPTSGAGKLPGIAGDPIPGIPIGPEGNPEGIKVSATTDGNGAFQFTNLRPGKYRVTLPDGRPGRSISVDPSGTFAGTVKRGSDGTVSIFDRWGTPVEGQQAATEANTAMGDVSTTRGTAPKPTGSGQLPGIVGTPIQGTPIGLEHDPEGIKVTAKTDRNGAFQFTNLPAGRYKVTLPDGQPGRSISVDATGTFAGTVKRGSDGTASIFDRWGTPMEGQQAATEANSALATVSTTRGTAPKPTGSGENLPGIAGTPIQGTPIGLEGDPGSIKVSATTDGNGAFQFTNLPAGKYKVTLPDGRPGRSISVDASGTFAGTVKRGSDGTASIFDRWGIQVGGQQAATEANSALQGVSTTRGTAPNPTNPGQLPGIAGTPSQGTPIGLDQDAAVDVVANSGALIGGTAPKPTGSGNLPGIMASDPIPGIDIIVQKKPGGVAIPTPTGADGTYTFTGLAPGEYELSIAGQLVQTIAVGNGRISGVLSREPGGKASITANGQTGVIPALPGTGKPGTGFGSGPAWGGFTGGGGPGAMVPASPMSPGAGPMGPGAGPMGPGAGPMGPGAGPMGRR